MADDAILDGIFAHRKKMVVLREQAGAIATTSFVSHRAWLGEFTAEELTNEDYHAAPGVSKSHLDVIADQSPRHYWQQYLNPNRPIEEKTDALILGDAIHVAALQPELLGHKFAVKPDVDRRTTRGKEIYAQFKRDTVGKQELSQKEFDCCLQIRDAVYRHPIAKGLMIGGVAEHSFFMRDAATNELIKCRADYLTDDYVIDLKSTLHADPENFSKDATKYRYDVAVPWYMDIIAAVTKRARRKWLWIAIEKEAPYAIGIYTAQGQDIIRARDTARQNFNTILKHRKLGAWPDYGETIQPLVIKPWARR